MHGVALSQKHQNKYINTGCVCHMTKWGQIQRARIL